MVTLGSRYILLQLTLLKFNDCSKDVGPVGGRNKGFMTICSVRGYANACRFYDCRQYDSSHSSRK